MEKGKYTYRDVGELVFQILLEEEVSLEHKEL